MPERCADALTSEPESDSSDGLTVASQLIYALAVIAAVGALIGGVALIIHAGQNCVPNPYNDTFGTDLSTCKKTHPFAGSGIAVLVGGLLQAAVFATVARLCSIVSELRRQR